MVGFICLSLVLAAVIIFNAAGCRVGGGTGKGGEVHLRVTTDFGRDIVFEEVVQAEAEDNINALLEGHLKVEYAYGGGFINSIEGIHSGYTGQGREAEKKDWFLYFNGVLSDTAAGSHYPGEGDVIWWDYHSWEEELFVPAVVGAFPQPFLNGYGEENPGTLIMFGRNAEAAGEMLAAFLEKEGAEEVELQPYLEDKAGERSRITVVLALWEELEESAYWQGLQENRAQTGWFVEFHGDHIYPLNSSGERVAESGHFEGAVIATGSGMGDSCPLWLVTAMEEEGLERLANVIVSSPDSLSGKAGAVLQGDELRAVPLDEGMER